MFIDFRISKKDVHFFLSRGIILWIELPINLYVSCKLHPYTFTEDTVSPTGPHFPRRIVNTHPRNYYNLKGKDIDELFYFLSWGIILWIELPPD